MEISQLEKLEKTHNFEYPKLYRQLCNDGMLNTGKYGPNWYKENYPKVKDNPPFLLFSNDVEIIEEYQLEEYVEQVVLREEPYDMVDQKLKMIPFAEDHSGDLFCFYYNEQQGDDVPIIRLSHDSDYFVVLAKNLQDFIFRMLLESYADFNCPTGSAYTEQQKEEGKQKALQDGRAMLENHKKHLTSKLTEILDEIYSRVPSDYTDQYEDDVWGLICPQEAQEVLKSEIEFPLLGKEIKYC